LVIKARVDIDAAVPVLRRQDHRFTHGINFSRGFSNLDGLIAEKLNLGEFFLRRRSLDWLRNSARIDRRHGPHARPIVG
jgi:hypothetical protein